MKNFIFLSVMIGLGTGAACVFAQGTGEGKTQTAQTKAAIWVWQESISELRKTAQILIDTHDKLTADNAALFAELSNLQKSLDEAKKEQERLKGEPERISQLMTSESSKEKPLSGSIKTLESKMQQMTKDNQKLKEKLSRLLEKLKPWEDQMAGLNAKKTDLEVELKLHETSVGNEDQELAASVEGLKTALTENQQKEQDLKKTLKETQEEYGLSSQPSQPLNAEVKQTASELAKLQTERKKALAAIEELKNKNSSLEKTVASFESAQSQEILELEAMAEETRSEISRLKEPATEEAAVASDADRQKTLHDSLQALEKENQDLENRIFDLSQAIDVIKKDSAMVEALLRSGKEGEMPSMSPFDNITEALAYAYAYHGMYEEAVAKYDQALKEGGDKRNIYFNLGYIYTQMGNTDEALRYYKYVLKINPHDYEAKRNIAKLREDKRR